MIILFSVIINTLKNLYKMDILKNILEDGLSPTLALVGVCLVCGYIWKQYLKYIKTTKTGISRNYDLMKEVQELVKNSEQTNKTINDEINSLQDNIRDLEKRLNDLEKLDIKANGELSSILKEIETVRKNMETYQMLAALSNKNDLR